MTQADVARVLEEEHGLKLHATAIAKMEQRDVDRPRTIRLSEARAIADMFGLTVDEMASAAENEIQAVARELVQLGAQADSLVTQTESVMGRLRSLKGVMAVPEEQLTPEIRVARNQIIDSLNRMDYEHRLRINEGQSYIREFQRLKAQVAGVNSGALEPDDIRALQISALSAAWDKILRRLYPEVSPEDLIADSKLDGGDSNNRLAALLSPPNDAGSHWLMPAVFGRGLWGHGVAIELDERISRLTKENPRHAIPFVKYMALREMAEEVQVEMEEKWPVVTEFYQQVEQLWRDPEGLRQWIEAPDSAQAEAEADS